MHCFISYLVNDRDVPGVLVQNYSLKHKFGINTDYFCIITKDVSEGSKLSLSQDGIKLLYINIDDIYINLQLGNTKIDILNSSKYKVYMVKFCIFMAIPDEYTTCMYIDADTLFMKDPSIGFSIPNDNAIHMVKDQLINYYKMSGQPPLYELEICDDKFNSGCILFNNTKYIWNKFISFISNCSCEFLMNGSNDQHIFNEMHKSKNIKIKQLDEIYNLIPCIYKCFTSCEFVKHDDIIMIHYTLSPKPWQGWYEKKLYNQESKQLYMYWHRIYMEYLDNTNNIDTLEISFSHTSSLVNKFKNYINDLE